MRSIHVFHGLTEQVMFWYEFGLVDEEHISWSNRRGMFWYQFGLGAKETLYFVQYVVMDEYGRSFKPGPLLSVRSMALNALFI